jgi:hypothetical protein
MPMVLRLPHTQKTDLDAYTGDRSRDYSLLGFGDIVRHRNMHVAAQFPL